MSVLRLRKKSKETPKIPKKKTKYSKSIPKPKKSQLGPKKDPKKSIGTGAPKSLGQ